MDPNTRLMLNQARIAELHAEGAANRLAAEARREMSLRGRAARGRLHSGQTSRSSSGCGPSACGVRSAAPHLYAGPETWPLVLHCAT